MLGGSRGVTLGLAYAQRHPERVSEMVLVAVAMTRPQDIHWLCHKAGRYFPEQWARYREGGGEADDFRSGYDRLLNAHRDPAVRVRAAQDWRDWEDAVVSLEDGWAPNLRPTSHCRWAQDRHVRGRWPRPLDGTS